MSALATRRGESGFDSTITMLTSEPKSALPSTHGFVCVHALKLRAYFYKRIDMAKIPDAETSARKAKQHKALCIDAVSVAIAEAIAEAEAAIEDHEKQFGKAGITTAAYTRSITDKADAKRAEEAARLSPSLRVGAKFKGTWELVKGLYVSRSSARPRLVVDAKCLVETCRYARTFRGCDVISGKIPGCAKCNDKARRELKKQQREIFKRLKAKETTANQSAEGAA